MLKSIKKRKRGIGLALLLLLGLLQAAQSQVVVRKIWENDHYNAFTSLIVFKDDFYCAFRQGNDHAGGMDGVVRIIKSKDGITWKPAATIEKEGYDLRDPKLSITPDGRLMVIIGGSVYKNKELLSRLSHVSFSDPSGETFSAPEPISLDEKIKTDMDWLWRVTWHDGTGYGVVYRMPREIALVKTKDGVHYDLVKDFEEVVAGPNESTVRLSPNGEMFMMVRRKTGNGLWGRSKPPYKKWTWTDASMAFGGPDFKQLNDSLFIAGTRVYEDPVHTGLYLVNREGQFRKIVQLPSGGDNSYPGFVIRDKKVYVSYYSSHEGHSAIYLAEVPLSLIEKKMAPPPIAESVKIWDKAPHNAFTDLIHFNGYFYCTFREGPSHVGGNNGTIRVIASDDGKQWASVALLQEEAVDLRDPKLSITPDERLMLMCGGSTYAGNKTKEWHTRVFFSKDGRDWTKPLRVKGMPVNNWAFGITWMGNVGYTAPRICGIDSETGLLDQTGTKIVVYKTTDGVNYEQVTDDLTGANFDCGKGCGEASITFDDERTMAIIVRVPGKGKLLLGEVPYKHYKTVDIDHGMGGPEFLQLEDKSWIVATREYPDERPGGRKDAATVLLKVNEDGVYDRLFELPSGGDNSYPGMTLYQNELWISYYSSHDGRASIYLSRIPLSSLKETVYANAIIKSK